MRSVLTTIVLLLVLSWFFLYILNRRIPFLDGFSGGGVESREGGYGRRGWESGGGTSTDWRWKWYYGIIPYYGYDVLEEQSSIKERFVDVEQPCSTDLDCQTGHCSMFGICTNGFSL